MNILSLFDGMSCGRIALERIGVKIDSYYASEIDKFAIKVSQSHYPDTKQLGSVIYVKGVNLPKIDLLIGGSPCQGLSFAGKGLNFEDQHSRLFFEFVRLLDETKPKYFLLENVCMKKEYEQTITSYLGVEPILINSALVSAQNRKRLYWTNINIPEQPKDKGITWDSVREHGVNKQSYYYTKKAMQWLGHISQKKNKPLIVHTDKMQMLEASHYKKYSNQRFFGIVDLPDNGQTVAAMRDRYSIYCRKQERTKKQHIEFRYDDKTNSLITVTKDKIITPFTLPNMIPAGEFFFRYITPLECERLQTVPDNFTNVVSDTQRYKMLGNGWTVDVISHILKGI